jgi:hypothetical protein
MDETVSKAKKARKPYVWTPQRKEAFERMKKKRDEMIKNKKEAAEKGKADISTEKSRLNDLMKNTQKIKMILSLIDGETPVTESKPVVEVKEEIVEKVAAKPKKVKVKEPPPPPPPVEESESETEAEEEEEEEPPPPPPPKPKPPVNTFRYTTQTSHVGLPKGPSPKPVPAQTPMPKRSPYLFL